LLFGQGRAAARSAAVQPVGGPARPEGRCRALPQDRHLLLVELPWHLLTKRDVYCCFQSKISRILQEQGRPQIGKTWGTPKKPVCDGFTIFEFQQLDLSVMDFSEIYAEFVDAAKLPDEAATLIEIQAKIEAYYAAHKP
jgi:hypothetical protein